MNDAGEARTAGTSYLSPQATFWVILCSVVLTVFAVFSAILLPFVAGFVLAYLFHPVANRLRVWGLSRSAASFAIVAVGILAIAVILALIVPPIFQQLGELIQDLPGYFQHARAYLTRHYGHVLQQISPSQEPGAAGPVEQQIRQNVTPWLVSELQKLLKSGLDVFNSLALLFLTPVVTFFMLRDWDKMIASIDHFFPRDHAPVIRQLADEIDVTIAGYLRGTSIVLAIVSGFYMIALGIVGLNYGLIIGLGAGIFSFVPYLGSTVGFLVSGGVAVSQYWPDYTKIAIVCGIFIFGQLMEGNVLTPNIVGNRVRLHPVWLLFALIASGYLLGFLGLLISVPLAAAIGVLVRHVVKRYYQSAMYGAEGNHEQEAEGSGL
jgi:predicted PurR-regulated permease PerM